MTVSLNVAAMRRAFAPVPYPGMNPALSSKLLVLRMREPAMVPLVVGQPLLNLPVVPPRLNRQSTADATLHCLL